MQKQNHKAKKSLGQNFLKSNLALKKIIEAGEISKDDIVLEIGPGKGALTEKLLEKSNCVIAVEKDRNLFQLLQEKFAQEISAGKLVLIEDDILKFDIKKALQDVVFKSIAQAGEPSIANFQQKIMRGFKNNILQSFSYKVIANIPYNITGAILKKFLTEKKQPSLMVLMVQNEVAKRIIARDKKESILSISVKAYGEPKMIMKVPARYFSPAPKVDSAIIAIKNISRKNFNSPLEEYPLSGGRISTPSCKQATPQEGNKTILEEKFWEIVRAGFAHKRKKLSSNLKKYVRQDLTQELENKRAEDLSFADWINLAKN